MEADELLQRARILASSLTNVLVQQGKKPRDAALVAAMASRIIASRFPRKSSIDEAQEADATYDALIGNIRGWVS